LEISQKQHALEALLGRAVELHLNVAEGLSYQSSVDRKSGGGHSSRPSKIFGVILAAALLAIGVPATVVKTLGGVGVPDSPTIPAIATVVELAPAINGLVDMQGAVFFKREMEIHYAKGPVILSGALSPAAPFSVDDAIMVTVTRSDGTESRWTHVFNADCYPNSFVDAQDLTWMFRPGVNTLRVELADVCGTTWGTSGAILLTNGPLG